VRFPFDTRSIIIRAMQQSLCKVILYVIFSTKNREPCLNDQFQRSNNLLCCRYTPDDGKRSVVHADEKLTAFLGLEKVTGDDRD